MDSGKTLITFRLLIFITVSQTPPVSLGAVFFFFFFVTNLEVQES